MDTGFIYGENENQFKLDINVSKCVQLSDCYGEKFKNLYEKYENEGKGKTVKARDLWNHILTSQIETGTPYFCIKMLVIVNLIKKI